MVVRDHGKEFDLNRDERLPLSTWEGRIHLQYQQDENPEGGKLHLLAAMVLLFLATTLCSCVYGTPIVINSNTAKNKNDREGVEHSGPLSMNKPHARSAT